MFTRPLGCNTREVIGRKQSCFESYNIDVNRCVVGEAVLPKNEIEFKVIADGQI